MQDCCNCKKRNYHKIISPFDFTPTRTVSQNPIRDEPVITTTSNPINIKNEYSKNSLESKDTFIIDRGDAVVVWIGNKTSKNEKRFARYYAIRYLREMKRNPTLPILVVTEGKLSFELDKCFNF